LIKILWPFSISSMRATCLIQVIHLDLITLTFGEQTTRLISTHPGTVRRVKRKTLQDKMAAIRCNDISLCLQANDAQVSSCYCYSHEIPSI
jgi:hypothetical protein